MIEAIAPERICLRCHTRASRGGGLCSFSNLTDLWTLWPPSGS